MAFSLSNNNNNNNNNNNSDNGREKHAIPNYAKDLAHCLNDFRKNKTMCDVILIVSNKEYFAHRNVLCASSPYFLEQLRQTDSLGSKIELTNISTDVFEDVLNFIYIGEICVGQENVRKLISASDILHMTSLKEVACRYYEKRLCPSNCLSIAALANEFNAESLRTAADKFILEHFLEVSRYEEFKFLTCPHLVKIISSDDIVVEREEQVYMAAMEWIHAEFEQRRIHLGTIFKCIRLLQTSKYFIYDVLDKYEELRQDEECARIINEAKNIFNFPDRKHMYQFRKEFAPRRHSDVCNIIVACGGNQERMSSNEVLCYVPLQDFWYPLAPLQNSRFSSASVMVNNEIFCLGGKIEGRDTNVVERYCFTTDRWVETAPLPEPMSNHLCCIYNGEMYVIGGGKSERSSNLVHKYSTEKRLWERVRNTLVPRRNACVASHEYLYVIGGYGPDNQALASMERYNPYTNEWSKTFPMNSARACASAACVRNSIFVFGGEYATWSYYRSAEVFNILTDEWRGIRDMSVARAFMGVATLGEQIYLIGGMVSAEDCDKYGAHADEDEFVDVNETKLVECYDIHGNSWRKMCSLPVATAGTNCCVVSSCMQLVTKRCGFE